MKIKTIVTILLILIIFIFLSLTINIQLQKSYTKRTNEIILNLIGAIKEEYPNVTDNEIINILNNNDNSYDLAKYGINSDDIHMLQSTKSILDITILFNVVLILFLGMTLLFIYMNFIKQRRNKTNEILDYIKEINNKNYSLRLDENDEDELSRLQNELYKITILLKEQSENALKDKKNIKDSLSDISHQLKTPLTSIMIGLENLSLNPKMDIKTRDEFLIDIRKQTENINFLIISILKLSRFDADVIKFDKKTINVKRLLDETLDNLSNIINKNNINIEINGEKDITFLGDYKWQLEAITNIVKNSVEHLNEKGLIKINYRKLSIYTEIEIEDNGKGIDSKDLKHIFERFYKGKNSSKDSVGIGLSLAKKIIENDNGIITVKSKVNEGTKFIIRYMRK